MSMPTPEPTIVEMCNVITSYADHYFSEDAKRYAKRDEFVRVFNLSVPLAYLTVYGYAKTTVTGKSIIRAAFMELMRTDPVFYNQEYQKECKRYQD